MLALLRNSKVRDALLQILFVGSLAALIIGGALVAHANLASQRIISGFDFLYRSTGWDINFALLPVSASDPYWWFFVNGIINTLFLGTMGLILATLVGGLVGLARTSRNELAQLLGRIYVDLFRNIPLILQVIFWYAVLTRLPPPRLAIEAGGVLLSNRGLYVPVLAIGAMPTVLLLACLIAALALPVWIGASKRFDALEQKRGRAQLGAALSALALGAAVIMLAKPTGAPLLDSPQLQGLNVRGGVRIQPEMTALLIGMGVYGGAYIGEIVRGGFKAVGKGQVEAAQSLGLTPWRTFTLVKLPLALRAMLPILANQYIWLIKATTMGIVVGFSDFFMIAALAINHSGRTLEAIALLMGGFLAINLSLAALFNRVNRAVALKGHQVRT